MSMDKRTKLHNCTIPYAQSHKETQKNEEKLEQDVFMLTQHKIGEGENRDDIHIFATNREVNNYNSCMSSKKSNDIVTIYTQDFERIAKTGLLERKQRSCTGF